MYFSELLENIMDELTFRPAELNPHTFITSFYLHSSKDIFHILINMITLFFLGIPFERKIGTYKFSAIYFASGIMGNLFHAWFASYFNFSLVIPCLGASGAIFGVLGAFAILYPNEEIPIYFVFFILPNIKVYLAAIIFAIIQFVYAFLQVTNIGYLAHFGGLTTGIFISLLIPSRKILPEKKYYYEHLGPYATTEYLNYILNKIKAESVKEIRDAWIEKFTDFAICTQCNKTLKLCNCKKKFTRKST